MQNILGYIFFCINRIRVYFGVDVIARRKANGDGKCDVDLSGEDVSELIFGEKPRFIEVLSVFSPR